MEHLTPEDPRVLGDFRLLCRIGAGGFGEVFLGRQVSRGGGLAAIKLIRQDIADSERLRPRFASEVEAVSRAGGLGIPELLGADGAARRPWLATRYIPGPSLQQLVDEAGPLPESSVWSLAAGLAESFSQLHAAGLFHRDLKPSNVLITRSRPWVIDFSLVRLVDDPRLTGVMDAMGSFQYAALEQLEGLRHARGEADVFALGACLLFAATGHPPRDGRSYYDIVMRARTEPPNLSGLPRGALRELVASCLENLPDGRPAVTDVRAEAVARTAARGPQMRLPEPALAVLDRHRGLLRTLAGVRDDFGEYDGPAGGPGASRTWARQPVPPVPTTPPTVPTTTPQVTAPTTPPGHRPPTSPTVPRAQTAPTVRAMPGAAATGGTDPLDAGGRPGFRTPPEDDRVRGRVELSRPAAPPVPPVPPGRAAAAGSAAAATGGVPDSAGAGGASVRAGWSWRCFDWLRSAPLVYGELVLAVTASGALHALDRTAGTERWRLDLGGTVRGGLAGAGGTVAVGTADGTTHVVRVRSGGPSHTLVRFPGPVHAVAFAAGTGDGRADGPRDAARPPDLVVCSRRDLHLFDPAGSETRWTAAGVGVVVGTPAVDDSAVYCRTDDGVLGAWRLHDGAPLWRTPVAGAPYAGPVVGRGDVVYAACADGTAVAVDAQTGRLLWSAAVGGTIHQQPVLTDEMVVLGTAEGAVVALRAADGSPLWRAHAPAGAGLSALAAGPDTVYAADRHGVRALSPQTGTEHWRWEVGGVAGLRATGDALFAGGLDGVLRSAKGASSYGRSAQPAASPRQPARSVGKPD